MNRKKRLKKGIKSIDKQIVLHKEKKEKAEKEGNLELMSYYTKEIEAKKKDKKHKEELLGKV